MARFLLVGMACCWLLVFAAGTSGQEFRIETDIHLPPDKDDKVQVLQNLTLFTNSVIYDFLRTKSEEVVMFDLQRKRFVLLDPARRVQTTLSTDQVLDFTARIKAQAIASRESFLYAPKFDEEFDEMSGRLTLTSKQMIYRAKGAKPKFPVAVHRFHEFSDWYARLNAMRPDTGSLPPFARLELNRALAAHGLVPEEVEREITSEGNKSRTQKIHSTHLANWQLSSTDRERIEQVGVQLATFTQVDFFKYCEHSENRKAPESTTRRASEGERR